MTSYKKETSPHTPLKKKNIYNKLSYDNVAGAGALTHEGRIFFHSRCLDPLFREKGEWACSGVADAYESLCIETLTDWAAIGQQITDSPETCRHFLATLRKKAEHLRQQRASLTNLPIEKRKQRFMKEIKVIRDSASSDVYDRVMLNDFYRYYTQLTPDGLLLAFETKPFWDTKTRLDQWIRQEKCRQQP